METWCAYVIGSDSTYLPCIVVRQSGPRGPRGGTPLWGSGFLPSSYQVVHLRNTGEPILNLGNPKGIGPDRQRDALDAIKELNETRLEATGDPEIATRIAQYEMAYRMQTSAPELIDIARESAATLKLY